MLPTLKPVFLTQKARESGLYPEPCNHIMMPAGKPYKPKHYSREVIDVMCLDGKVRTVETNDITEEK